MVTNEEINRLEKIQTEIEKLVHEAFDIVKGTSEEESSRIYWKSGILSYLGCINHQTGSLESIIEELKYDN